MYDAECHIIIHEHIQLLLSVVAVMMESAEVATGTVTLMGRGRVIGAVTTESVGRV